MNHKIKILTVIGARPQFIKAATLSSTIQNSFSDSVTEIIVHTGQHYDSNMSDIFFSEMKIPKPRYNLNIGGFGHAKMTGRMMEGIEKICAKEHPDWVVVYGDTNSTLAAAIVASKHGINLAHIEAGLRSYKMSMPEEINRILTDRVSNLLFCPTDYAIENLISEGYKSFSNVIIKNVGDIMYESVLHFSKKSKKPSFSFDLKKNNYVLATIHRAEVVTNRDKLASIISALNIISESRQVIAPLHPRTLKSIKKFKLETKFNAVLPVSYLEMLWLIQNSKLVVTDSGGIQKEAFFLKKVCLIAREETEWVQLLQSSNSKMVGFDKNKILSEYTNSKKFKSCKNLFGNGNTSEQIINSIINYNNE